MGVQRPAEHHYVRRTPPPERDAERWMELVDGAGRTFWLDVDIWMRPVPIRSPAEIPTTLAEVVAETASRPVGPGESAPFLRFLHEALFYELLPSAVGLDEAAFEAAIPAIADALRAAGCEYVETEE